MLTKLLSIIGNLLLFIFSLIVSVGLCVGLVNAYDYLNSEGAFSTWMSLSEPPDKLARIVSANYSTIWIETEDGSIYYLNVLCWLQGGECEEQVWKKSETLPFDHNSESGTFLFRQNICIFSDEIQSNYFHQPKGNIVECLKAYYLYPEGLMMTYYAKSSDNTIQYWHIFSPANAFFQQLIAAVLIGVLLSGIVFSLLKSSPNLLKRFGRLKLREN